jgi:hypothetical protein
VTQIVPCGPDIQESPRRKEIYFQVAFRPLLSSSVRNVDYTAILISDEVDST